MVGVIMKRSRRKRVNYKRVSIAVLILGLSLFLVINGLKRDKKVYMIDTVNREISSVREELDKYDLNISVTYKYSDDILKDYVISQSIDKDTLLNDGDNLSLVVSLGKLDKEKLKQDGINELGKVPIMMYHGIKNIKNSETKYTKGNVDKDGYTRTVEAFRDDLEFYYQNGYILYTITIIFCLK